MALSKPYKHIMSTVFIFYSIIAFGNQYQSEEFFSVCVSQAVSSSKKQNVLNIEVKKGINIYCACLKNKILEKGYFESISKFQKYTKTKEYREDTKQCFFKSKQKQ